MGLFARVTGLKEGAPLVLLHGFGLGGFAWDPVLDRLQDVCPVITYDLPGHAGSLDHGVIGGAGQMAKAVLADLQDRGTPVFHVAGHSLGGAVGAIMALREPGKVKSLTLVAPGGIGREINHQALRDYAAAQSRDDIRRTLVPLMGETMQIPDRLVEAMLTARAHPAAISSLSVIFAGMLVESGEGIFQGTLPMQQLAGLRMPVAALWGERDMIVPSHQARLLPSNISTRILAAKGHMLLDDSPQDVADILASQIRT